MEEEVFLTALAALFQGIGRFAELAGTFNGTRPHVCKVIDSLAPDVWCQELACFLDPSGSSGGRKAKALSLADRLSAGGHVAGESVQPAQLRSIFCSLEADGWQCEGGYLPLSPLKVEKSVLFPGEALEQDQAQEACWTLWEEFSEHASQLRKAHTSGDSRPAFLESLLLLFQRYGWCIPVVCYPTMTNVSLYDHSRATAGLSVCLMHQEEALITRLLDALEKGQQATEESIADSPLENFNTQLALLVGGDVSGVQDFIYTITARGATSALRGRSFYLQLLTEVTARFVLQRLGLPITNLLYQGGGNFFLLARPSDKRQLEEVQQEISRILLAQHDGDLYLALASVPLTAGDFCNGRISGRWEELGRNLQKAKHCRFAELGDDLRSLFIPRGHGGDEERQCQVCGREHTGTYRDNDTRKCPPCLSYEELGDALRQARYLWIAEVDPLVQGDPPSVVPGGWREVLRAFGVEAGVTDSLSGVPDNGRLRWVLALKDEAMPDLTPNVHTVVGRRFLVNVTPLFREADELWLKRLPKPQEEAIRQELPRPLSGRIKSFAILEAQATGIRRLGVLRMDVDDLGKLFAEGFGTAASLSRVAALSFAVSLFFEGWVEVLAERIGKTEDGRERIYSIYSGGDDLFFVGSWDALVELARAIRADLSRFAAGHPNVHASAGIVLVSGKYPLYQAAQDTQEAEGRAKELRWHDDSGKVHQKDAVTFLGQVVPWQRFGLEECRDGMETVHTLMHWLERLTRPKDQDGPAAPKTLLQMLIQLQEQYQAAVGRRWQRAEERNLAGEKQVYYGPWVWQGYYFLKRMSEQLGQRNAEASAFTRELAQRLHQDWFQAIEWIGLAARWAELLVRD